MSAHTVSAQRDRTDPIPDLDLGDPDPASSPLRDATLDRLRAEHPVFWHAPKSRPGFWAVISYRHAMQVYRDSATYSASHGMTLDSLRPEPDPASGIMVEVTDPPAHRRLRRSVAHFFTEGAVGDLAPLIDDHVASLVEGVATGEVIDFAEDVAAGIPTFAAGLLLGLPAADLGWITSRTAQVFLSGAEGDRDLRRAAEHANNELLSYFARLLQTSTHPGAPRGMVRRLAEGTASRDGLSGPEVILNSLNLAIGGTTTTRSVLTNLMHALLGAPGVLTDLAAHPEKVPAAVEETVRWANPVHHLARVATADVELGGHRILAGDPVLVWARSANRDESVFPDPGSFDIDRRPNPHIGFAAGTHGCPGTTLARAQLRSTLTHLSRTVAHVRAAGPARLMQSNFLHGYTALPVVLHPARHRADDPLTRLAASPDQS
jgi:cytochrome P450